MDHLVKKRKNDERSDSIKIEEPEEKKQCLDSNQTDMKDNDNKLFHSINVPSAVSKDVNQAADVYDQIKIDNDNDNKSFQSNNISNEVSKDMNQVVDVYDQTKIDNDKIRMNELESLENCFSTLRQNYAKETQ